MHLDLLKAYACDVAQGYFFSRPLAGPVLIVWLGPRARAAGAWLSRSHCGLYHLLETALSPDSLA
jgi:hypothetical protein